MDTVYQASMATPLGPLCITCNSQAVTSIEFTDKPTSIDDDVPLLAQVKRELQEYFSGSRIVFEFPLQPQGTEFQQKVWQALRGIEHGQLASYGEIAKRIGSPKGMRAVGMANRNNPVAIVIPCHRVIGANGTLTGYAGGLDKKAWLLELEGSADRLRQSTS
ncbi:methylated-DNA--[protein]-cysteine S-methyltransferase [Pseudidiomarina salilacus]|uniref:methylated-DNA--[protein]-cysteine S-methyltransferase n=1 Tax=Pseudidiomarina salilacus TaxID=3384452 RepID=UPI003984A52C